MYRWLEWLARFPGNVVSQCFTSSKPGGLDGVGSRMTFGVYPANVAPHGLPPRFDWKTFRALQRRGWIEMFHESEEVYSGYSLFADGRREDHYSRWRYWRVSEKGKSVLAHWVCNGKVVRLR